MKKEEATEMKQNLESIYPSPSLRFNIPVELKGRSDDDASNKWYEENGWYVAVWVDDMLVSTLNDYQQLEAWRTFARVIVQAEKDIEEESVDDSDENARYESISRGQSISEGWHL